MARSGWVCVMTTLFQQPHLCLYPARGNQFVLNNFRFAVLRILDTYCCDEFFFEKSVIELLSELPLSCPYFAE